MPLCSLCYATVYEGNTLSRQLLDQQCATQRYLNDLVLRAFLDSFSCYQEKWQSHIDKQYIEEMEDLLSLFEQIMEEAE